MDYSEFRKQYEQQHPASIPQRIPVASEYPRWLTPTAVLMFVASAFVSGLHTASAVVHASNVHLGPSSRSRTWPLSARSLALNCCCC
jgi:hypothetical protein